MTIRFYPSRLPGEPLETHEHGVTSIRSWLVANVEGYEDRDVPPLTVEVEGLLIPPGEWAKCVIHPDSDVRLYPVPFGLEAATIAWIGVGIAVASAAYSLFMMSNIDAGGYTSSTGRSLDLNPAKANTAKLGDAIREVFGRVRIYPDYVVQPVTRFDAADPTKMRVKMTEIAPVVGMPVTLGFNSVDYDLFIASYTPGQAAVPGTGGSAAKLQASAAPTTYDFSTSSSTFTITWQGVTYPVSLVANYVSMSGLLAAITEGLTGSGLVAQDNGGTVLITEAASPFAGGAITSSSLPAAVFGDAPVYTSGTASTGGSPAVTANVTLAYNSATGTAFSGMPEGVQRLSLAHRGNEYRIVSADGTTATVARLVSGAVDESWPGFSARTMIDYEATGLNDTLSWLGPFLVCPENEVVDAFEVNFSFPNGICGFDSKGKKRIRHVEWEIQYRVYGSGSGWVSHQGEYALKNVNGLGFTERITLSSPGLVEVRCRRRNEQGSNNARDSMYWQALRGRLLTRPSSYPGVSLMAVTVETGGKLAAQSDRRVNVVATRAYETGTARTISGALLHVGNSLGLEMDVDTITALESAYWTPRGENFDFATVRPDGT